MTRLMEMIPFENAYDIVISSGFKTGTEVIPFTDSLNRILAGDVISDIDMPPFDKATVDGFACRKSDLENDLEIIETIPAGKWPAKEVRKNQCSRIMTGAPVPEGADCIIMVEDTLKVSTEKIRYQVPYSKENIAFRGEDVRRGEIVLKAGRKIRPRDIAVMASVGHISVTVSKMPRVAVISSGSELVEPSEFPGISQIRNSNASQLMAQIAEADAVGRYYGIAEDDEEQTLEMVNRAIAENDMVLISGGVSMGDFDFVPSVLEKAGVRILFSRVAVQPGKPTTFGLHSDAVVFGLPGNPVSSLIQFELLVRPLISLMMGHDWKPLSVRLPMSEKYKRRHAERMALIPVKITAGRLVSPVEYHGSAHISALPEADGIIVVPVGRKALEKGEIVSVQLF
jgi:molybdopterin molybdotransferase